MFNDGVSTIVAGTARQCTKQRLESQMAVRSNLALFTLSILLTFCFISKRWHKLACEMAACKARNRI